MKGNITLYGDIISSLFIHSVFSRREGGYGISYSDNYGYHFLLTELKDNNQIRYLNSSDIKEIVVASECKADIGANFKYYCLVRDELQTIFVEINYLPSIGEFKFKNTSSSESLISPEIFTYSTSKVDFVILSSAVHLLLFNIEVNNKQSRVYGEISFLSGWNIHNNSLLIVKDNNYTRYLIFLNVLRFIPESK